MKLLLSMLAGLALSGQETPAPAEREATLPDIEVTASAPVTEAVVRVQCVLLAGGRRSDCRVLSERPSGMGFAETALRAAERSRLRPEAGVQPGAKVEWNVRFRPEDMPHP
jgi:protein TonB